jgi:hypothetical protein
MMTKLAVEKGLTPALVVLWCNYVPTSWASEVIGNVSVMPEDYLETYATQVTNLFKEFAPIYIIGGDTSLETDIVVRYYSKLLDYIKIRNPESLATIHLNPVCEIPESLQNNKNLDFYMYQSGHGGNNQENAWMFAEKFAAYPVRKPVVNGEPCYEGSCHGFQYPRFGAFDVRKAVWQSLLSGAKAGITYGAHGIWMFQQEGMVFKSTAFSGLPYYWRDTLNFEGAWKMGFIKWLFEKYNLFNTEPCQNLIEGPKEIRAAATHDQSLAVIYIPYALPLKINLNLQGYKTTLFLLDKNTVMEPCFSFEGGSSTLKIIPFNEDALLIAEKLLV